MACSSVTSGESTKLHMKNFCGFPSNIYKELQCSLCNNYLSYFPISLCSNNQSICGRCTVPDGLFSLHNEVFEAVSKHMKFPCRYKSEGCCEELLPNEVPQHEEHQCLYRVVRCIINKPNTCTWKGSLPTLLQHCKEDHTELVLKDGEFLIDLADDKEYDRLFENKETVYIVNTKLDIESKTLHFAVYNDPYHVVLSRKCKLVLEKDNIKLFFDFNTCGYTNMVLHKLILTSLINGEIIVEMKAKISVGDDDEPSKLDSKTKMSSANDVDIEEDDSDVEEDDSEIEDDDARSEATFRYTVQDFSKLKDSVSSPPFYVRNLPWRIKVMPRKHGTQDSTAHRSLGFFLDCNWDNKSDLWSCFAVAKLRLLSVRPDVEPISKEIKHVFSSKESDWGFSYFMAWNDVLNPKKGYIKDDTITLEVHVVADAPVGVSDGDSDSDST